MLTITRESPFVAQEGIYHLEIQIVSTQVDDISDSIELFVNGIEKSFEITSVSPFIIETDLLVYGPQQMIFLVKAEDSDEAKEEFLTLEIVSPVILNTSNRTPWAASINRLAAYLPEHTKGRGDSDSVYRQMINQFGLGLDDITVKNMQNNEGILFNKTRLEDPDWLYAYNQDVGEKFRTVVDTTGEDVYVPPTIYGFKEYNKLPVEIKTSAYELLSGLPTRFEAVQDSGYKGVLTGSIPFSETGLLGVYELDEPSYLYVQFHSLSNLVDVERLSPPPRLVLRGDGPYGIEQSESISVLTEIELRTDLKWKKFSVYLENQSSSGGEFIISSAPAANRLQADRFNRSKNLGALYYNLSSDGYSSYLDLYDRLDELVVESITGQDLRGDESRIRLLDPEEAPLEISSLAVDASTMYLYGVDDSYIYLWDRRQEQSDKLAYLSQSTTTPEQPFFVSVSDESFYNDDEDELQSIVKIDLDTPRGDKRIQFWDWSLVDSQGVRRYIDLDKQISDEGPWVVENSKQRFGIDENNFEITLVGWGDWVFELNITFVDGSTETYCKNIRIGYLKALAKYMIPRVVSSGGSLVTGDAMMKAIDVLPDGRLRIFEDNSSITLSPQFDTCLADFNEGRILFRNQFTKVEVNYDEQ